MNEQVITRRRVVYSFDNERLAHIGQMTGYIEYDAFDDEELFYPDSCFHHDLEMMGLEPAAGFWLRSALWAYVDGANVPVSEV